MKKQQPSYDKWVRFRERNRESNFKLEALIKEFAEFLRKVLPKDKTQEHLIPKLEVVSEQTLSIKRLFLKSGLMYLQPRIQRMM